MKSTLCILLALVCSAAFADNPSKNVLTGDAVTAYQDAVAQVQSGDYAGAVTTLNRIAKSHPRVAEIFATRCSALIGLRNFAAAEADCQYAFKAKPELSIALYSLAVAEEGNGKAKSAIEHYRAYAALDETAAPFKAQARAKADALSKPVALAVPPPPGAVAEATPPPEEIAVPTGTLFIYRNHFFSGSNQQVTLLIDDRIVGDIGHDQYVELQLPAGEHMVEAAIGGIRYYQQRALVFAFETSSDGRVRSGRIGGPESGPRVPGITIPVTIPARGQTYVNFDHVGGRLMLQQVPDAQARKEIRDDCTRAYSRNM